LNALLLKGGHVLTCDAQWAEHAGADVLIEGERIAAIGANLVAPPGTSVLDARNFVVMPGLVNAHLHSNENFEKGVYDNLPLELWMLWSYAPMGTPHLSPRDIYLRTMLSCIELIRNGATAVQDDVYNPVATPEAMDAVMAAYADSGLRGWVTTHLWDRGFTENVPFVGEMLPDALKAELAAERINGRREQIALFEHSLARWHGHDGRLRALLAPSGPQRCSEALWAEVEDLSRRHRLPIHTHVLETKLQATTGQELYGRTLVRYLADLGVLSDRLTLVHAIWLTKDDIALLAEHGCSVVHNPLSNLKLGSGVAPLREYLRAGVNVAIGTDGTSTSDTPNMLEAVKVAALMHKIGTHDYEEWIGAREALRMATWGGARSNLMHEETGELAPGKLADIILLDRRHWGFVPFNDATRQIAFSVTSEAVDTSIIHGRVVMQGRRLTTVDEGALMTEIAEAGARFKRDHWPKLAATAEKLFPYMAEVHRRGTAPGLEPGRSPLRAAPAFAA
jgi:5-methylthioadenosine/S-adenosylhomocysteine deaminase